MIVTGHQPNLLPGVSVVRKLASADVFIVCDEFQYVRHGFVNRNRLADGTALVAPVDEHDTYVPINRVKLAEQPVRWREKLARTLEHRLGVAAAPYAETVRRPWMLLAGLNVSLLAQLLDDLAIHPEWVFQTHLATGKHFGPMWYPDSADPTELGPVSLRLAMMVAEVGGTVWLSGASGRNYLDEAPFHERGIRVDYFDHDGPNPSAIELVRDLYLERKAA